MEDLISRSAVIDVLKETGIIQDNDLGHLVVDEINKIPIACNVDKVGEWIFKREGTYNSLRAYCSVCGKRSGIGGIKENQMKPYCPNCGAKMNVKAGGVNES